MAGETDKVLWRGVRPILGIRGIWPDVDATRVNETAAQANIGITIVYTVPASKILFLSSMFLVSRNDAEQVASIHALVRDGNDDEVYRIVSAYYNQKTQQASAMQYTPALEAETGWDVVVSVEHDDAVGRLIISGWLEDS